MFVLKKVTHERFIIDLLYASTRNAFYKDMYAPYGLKECLVHPKLYEALMKLVPVLKQKKLKLCIYDTFRPIEVQQFMYEQAPSYLKPYIAPPPKADSKRGFHPRGTAIDCYLTTEEGQMLDFPTTPDAFYVGYEKDPTYPRYLKRAHRDYQGADVTSRQIENRRLLEEMMVAVGLEPLPTEWWHFHLPQSWQYPLITSLKDVEIR